MSVRAKPPRIGHGNFATETGIGVILGDTGLRVPPFFE